MAEPWHEQAKAVSEAVVSAIPTAVGVYLHGSAVLGGFGPASDLDVLVVADDTTDGDWHAVGRTVLTAVSGERPVELSVVDAAAARLPSPPWPFLLHVNSGDERYVVGRDGGDLDLIAHYAVVRAAGLPLHGPAPEAVVGEVEREVMLTYLAGELEWGRAGADQRYAVLNACRAVAYAEEGALLSKVAGAQWWLEHAGPSPLVTAAAAAQQDGVDLGPCTPAAEAFVAEAIARLVTAQASRADHHRLR